MTQQVKKQIGAKHWKKMSAQAPPPALPPPQPFVKPELPPVVCLFFFFLTLCLFS